MSEIAEVSVSPTSNYIPKPGDLFEWWGIKYWCIESNDVYGTVNPIGETFYIRCFKWNFDGISDNFIRKATNRELINLGLAEQINH